MACTAYKYDKKFGPEPSPRAFTGPEEPIYMMKKVGPETFPTASTRAVEPIYIYTYIYI
jgi:hypothetical protein